MTEDDHEENLKKTYEKGNVIIYENTLQVAIKDFNSSTTIDLSNWKVTLPVANEKGKPVEIEPPEILDFAKMEIARPYMYIDSTKGAIVFEAMPTSATTRNTKYSRSD